MKSFLFIIATAIFCNIGLAASFNAQYATYALECSSENKNLHLMPLGHFEYADEIKDINFIPDYLERIATFAPITLKNLKETFSKYSIEPLPLAFPTYDDYGPLVSLPNGCKVISIATLSNDISKKIVVNSQYWKDLNEEFKQYYIYDLIIKKSLKKKLDAYSYRRFSLYTSTVAFYQLTTREKIDFLNYHGIYEYNLGGISISLNKEIIFYLDTDIIREAFPFPNATFKNATLDPRKFISFSKNEKTLALATMGPFKMKVKDQEFDVFLPDGNGILNNAADMGRGPYDERTNSRIYFYENGSLEKGFIKLVKNIGERVKNIQVTKDNDIEKFIEVSFYKNGDLSYFWVRPYYYISYGSGEITIENKTYKAMQAVWMPNGFYYTVSLVQGDGYKYTRDGNTQIYHRLFFNDKGLVSGGSPR